jgi:hypothetical protein
MTLTYQYPVLIPQGIYVLVPRRVIPATQTLTDNKQFQSLWKQAQAYNDYYAYIKKVKQTDGELNTHNLASQFSFSYLCKIYSGLAWNKPTLGSICPSLHKPRSQKRLITTR